MKLTCYVEEHCGIGGNIISRLDNGAFVGLIYSLLVFSQFHVDVVPPVRAKGKEKTTKYNFQGQSARSRLWLDIDCE